MKRENLKKDKSKKGTIWKRIILETKNLKKDSPGQDKCGKEQNGK